MNVIFLGKTEEGRGLNGLGALSDGTCTHFIDISHQEHIRTEDLSKSV